MEKNNDSDWFTPELAEKPYSIQATFLHWMAAHGAMCLALRHPQMTGASKQLIAYMIDGIEQLFKAGGMPQEQLNQIHLIESDAGGVASKSPRTGGDNDAIAPRKETANPREAYEEEGDRARRRVRSHCGQTAELKSHSGTLFGVRRCASFKRSLVCHISASNT